MLPGSVMKVVTLVAALESGVDRARHHAPVPPDRHRRRAANTCARIPDLKRPLSAAEALAHSCNDFFVSSGAATAAGDGQRRARSTRAAAGRRQREPAGEPRWSRRSAHHAARAARRRRAAGWRRSASARSPSLSQRGVCSWRACAAPRHYGSAQALGVRKLPVLAKTGTAPMPGGSWMGLVVALEPATSRLAASSSWRPARRDWTPRRLPRSCSRAICGAAGRQIRRKRGLTDHPARTGRRRRVRTPAGRKTRRSVNIARSRGVHRARRRGGGRTGSTRRRSAGAGDHGANVRARQPAASSARRLRLCDTTHCQVLRAPTDASRRAAEATAGRVLLHQGQPASVFYSASCGGHRSWRQPSGPAPWITRRHRSETTPVGRAAVGERDSRRRDRASASGGRASRRSTAGPARSSIGPRLRIASRGLRVDGFTPNEMTGHDFRMAVGGRRDGSG